MFAREAEEEVCHACFVSTAYLEFRQKTGSAHARECATCNKTFLVPYKHNGSSFCSKACKSESRKRKSEARPSKAKPKKKSIEQINQEWATREKKKGGRRVSLEELNRRSELKRAFDDRGWDHYLKGRRWDRI